MASQPTEQAMAEQAGRTPVGTIHAVDPNPFNWLFITWNTTDHWSRRNGGQEEEGREEEPGVTERIKQAAERLTGGSDGER